MKEVSHMKIQGPNHANMNPYKKQIQKQDEMKQAGSNQDKVEISSQAKQMQETTKAEATRQQHVESIKQQVASGEYEVDAKQTAKQMVNFWANRT